MRYLCNREKGFHLTELLTFWHMINCLLSRIVDTTSVLILDHGFGSVMLESDLIQELCSVNLGQKESVINFFNLINFEQTIA